MAKIYLYNNYITEGKASDIMHIVKMLETDAHIYARQIETETDGTKVYYLS